MATGSNTVSYDIIRGPSIEEMFLGCRLQREERAVPFRIKHGDSEFTEHFYIRGFLYIRGLRIVNEPDGIWQLYLEPVESKDSATYTANYDPQTRKGKMTRTLQGKPITCTECGVPQRDNAKFCDQCGARIDFSEPWKNKDIVEVMIATLMNFCADNNVHLNPSQRQAMRCEFLNGKSFIFPLDFRGSKLQQLVFEIVKSTEAPNFYQAQVYEDHPDHMNWINPGKTDSLNAKLREAQGVQRVHS